jgi:hypothetical protein
MLLSPGSFIGFVGYPAHDDAMSQYNWGSGSDTPSYMADSDIDNIGRMTAW